MKSHCSNVAACAGWAVVLFASVAAQAQISDPTQPPAAFLSQTRGAGREAAAAEPTPSQAQVQVTGSGRRFVMVGGRAVHPGETVGDAKLVSIGASGAVWQTGSGREVHSMSPAVQKVVLSETGTASKTPKKLRDGDGR